MKDTILSIKELSGFTLGNHAPMNGSNGSRLGLSGMISTLSGGRSMDGYEVKTEQDTFLVLIDNEQSCCESFGYFSTDDKLDEYIGARLLDMELTDKALKTEPIEELEYLDAGGVQFATFKTDKGDFQLAVYNAHNGYYGHGIIVAKNNEILCDDTL
jgi:hypothetical protein